MGVDLTEHVQLYFPVRPSPTIIDGEETWPGFSSQPVRVHPVGGVEHWEVLATAEQETALKKTPVAANMKRFSDASSDYVIVKNELAAKILDRRAPLHTFGRRVRDPAVTAELVAEFEPTAKVVEK